MNNPKLKSFYTSMMGNGYQLVSNNILISKDCFCKYKKVLYWKNIATLVKYWRKPREVCIIGTRVNQSTSSFLLILVICMGVKIKWFIRFFITDSLIRLVTFQNLIKSYWAVWLVYLCRTIMIRLLNVVRTNSNLKNQGPMHNGISKEPENMFHR